MPALDTNVLVRFLVRDDPAQHAATVRLMASVSETESLFVPLSVALELEWVLRSRYAVGKEAVIVTFVRLLETREILFQDEWSVERALSLYGEGTADFADCLHLASIVSHENAPMITFDRKAARLPDVTLLDT